MCEHAQRIAKKKETTALKRDFVVFGRAHIGGRGDGRDMFHPLIKPLHAYNWVILCKCHNTSHNASQCASLLLM